ncbi:hypothetical protein [Rhodovibrio sodomensis]|uniref:hypothetical protein n=1 Tax=Rhodovibrio sodomensis TaxID=1088 RepID=UPI0019066ABB|nr:hypothetical protein [Rhodovibrio sodomensis]
MDDLISDTPDATHWKPYVGGSDLRNFGPKRIQFLEYGTERVPALVRRPTFPELYDREKIMVGRFSGFVHDDGQFGPPGYEAFLTCNHTVFMLVPWHLLQGVDNRQIQNKVRRLNISREDAETESKNYPLPYLVALFNSPTWWSVIRGRLRSSIPTEIQPEDYSEQDIPLPEPDLMDAIVRLAEAAQDSARQLLLLQRNGWTIFDNDILAPTSAEPQNGPTSTIGSVRPRWGLQIHQPAARCVQLRIHGQELFDGRRRAVSFRNDIPREAIEFFVRLAREQPNGRTLQALEDQGVRIPSRPEDAADTEQRIQARELEAADLMRSVDQRRDEIEAQIRGLFRELEHPPVEEM